MMKMQTTRKPTLKRAIALVGIFVLCVLFVKEGIAFQVDGTENSKTQKSIGIENVTAKTNPTFRGWPHRKQNWEGSSFFDATGDFDGTDRKLKWTTSLPQIDNMFVLSGNVVGDQKLEIVSVQADTLYIIANDGSILTRVSVFADGYAESWVSVLADIDNDGLLDIGVGYRRSTNGAWIARFYGGDGALKKEFVYGVSQDGVMEPMAVLDGDVLMGQRGIWSASRRGYARWNIESATMLWEFNIGPYPMDLSIADFNKDGLYNLSYGSWTPHNGANVNGTSDSNTYLVIVDENGNQTLIQQYTLGSTDGNLTDMFVPFTDGEYGIVSFKYHNSSYPGTSKAHIRSLDGTITHTFNGLTNGNWFFGWADFNKDGKKEIIANNYTAAASTMYLFTDTLDIVQQTNLPVGSYFRAASDLSGDGFPDIIVAPITGNTIQILNKNLEVSASFDLENVTTIHNVIVSDIEVEGVPAVIVLTDKGIAHLGVDEKEIELPFLLARFVLNGNTNDISGNGHNAIQTGTTFTSDRFNLPQSALLLSENEYATVAIDTFVNQSNPQTLSFWFSTNALNSTALGGNMVAFRSQLASRFNVGLNDGKIQYSYGESDNQLGAISDKRYNDGEWHHVVFVSRGDGAAQKTIYVDGDSLFSFSGGNNNNTRSGNILLGGDVTENAFVGSLDDVRFYSRALNTGEVDSLHLLESAPSKPKNLDVIPSEKAITLQWSANHEADLAHYTVYKGESIHSLEAVHQSKATQWVDNAVTSRKTYFYAVTAVDTSAYESQRSDVSWATTHPDIHSVVDRFSGNELNSELWSTYSTVPNAEAGMNLYVNDTLFIVRGNTNDNNGALGVSSIDVGAEVIASSVDFWTDNINNWQDWQIAYTTPLGYMGYYNFGSEWHLGYLDSTNQAVTIIFSNEQPTPFQRNRFKIAIEQDSLKFYHFSNRTWKQVHSTANFSPYIDSQYNGKSVRVITSDRGVTRIGKVQIDYLPQFPKVALSVRNQTPNMGDTLLVDVSIAAAIPVENLYSIRWLLNYNADRVAFLDTLLSPVWPNGSLSFYKHLPESKQVDMALSFTSGAGFTGADRLATLRFLTVGSERVSFDISSVTAQTAQGTSILLRKDSTSVFLESTVIVNQLSPPKVLSGMEMWLLGQNLGNEMGTVTLVETPLQVLKWQQDSIRVVIPAETPVGELVFDVLTTDNHRTSSPNFSVIAPVSVWPGDTNIDGQVNGLDFLPIARYYLEETLYAFPQGIEWRPYYRLPWFLLEDAPALIHADTNGDGLIDGEDILTLYVNYGKATSVQDQVQTQPFAPNYEPIQKDSVLIYARILSENNTKMRLELQLDIPSIFQGFSAHLHYLGENLSTAPKTDITMAQFADPFILAQSGKNTSYIGLAGGALERVWMASSFAQIGVHIAEDKHHNSLWDLRRVSVLLDDGKIYAGKISWIEGQNTSQSQENSTVPERVELYQNFPNPFNPQTTIRFDVPMSQNVKLEVYDLHGRRVGVLVDKVMAAGRHSSSFNGEGLASGVYFARLVVGSQIYVKPMVLIK